MKPFILSLIFLFYSPFVKGVDPDPIYRVGGRGIHSSIQKHTLPNGAALILKEDNTTSLVTISLFIRTGSAYEEEFTGSGISHLIEHMIYKGTKKMDAQKISEKWKSMGGELDGSTSREYTNYSATIPKEFLLSANSLLYHIITNAEFKKEELIKEKGVITHEMGAIFDDPDKYLMQEFFSTAYSGHPYGEPVIGRKALFTSIERDDVISYYRKRYVPENFVLVIAGNFNTDEIKQAIEKVWETNIPPFANPVRSYSGQDNSSISVNGSYYGTSNGAPIYRGRGIRPIYIPSRPQVQGPCREGVAAGFSAEGGSARGGSLRGGYRPIYIPPRPQVQGPCLNIKEWKVKRPHVILGWHGPSLEKEDMYPMDILAEIMGVGEGSRLVKKLRNSLGVVSSISAYSYTPPNCTGIWAVSAELVIDDYNKAIRHILKELNRIKHISIRDSELVRAKKRIIYRILSSIESAEGTAGELGANEIYTRNPLFTKAYINGILRTQKEDIKTAAIKYFRKQHFILTALIPEYSVPIVGAGSKPALIESTPPIQKQMVAAGFSAEGGSARGGSLREKRDAPIQKLLLDNGIRILLKEKHDLPLVTIRLTSLGGLLYEDTPGISYLLNKVWIRSNQDITKRIEQNGGALSGYSGANSLGLTLEVLNEDVLDALRTVRELIQRDTIDRDIFEISKETQLAEIDNEDTRPYSYTFKRLKEIFYGPHPYGNSYLGKKETIAQIDIDEIARFKKSLLVPENMALSVFGDIDAGLLIPEIKKIFGEIPPRQWRGPQKDFPAIERKVNEKTEERPQEETIIALAYPGVTVYDKDRYGLDILEQLESGVSGRLFKSVREDEALSYSQGGLNLLGLEPGVFIFYITTKEESMGKAYELMQKEITKLKKGDITVEELEGAKNQLLVRHERDTEQNSSLSLMASLNEIYGLGYDYYLKYPEEIKKVTSDDIKEIANKYFRDDWHTLVIIRGQYSPFCKRGGCRRQTGYSFSKRVGSALAETGHSPSCPKGTSKT